ncbi:uncharacterized protein LOC116427995 isoform X2 [Nomia melanderi]|uniref:uncharacterized protein LOC116427995 isoform X2 n=1 Tax=Nomia melanderi TaxID=2448451 RepID=UPI003FCD06DC
MSKRKTIAGSCQDDGYQEYVNLSIEWNRWILKPMGVWPRSSNMSRLRRCFTRMTNALCYSLITFLFVPCGLYVFLEVEDIYDKLKLFGPLIFCVMAFMKYSSLIVHENEIRECMRLIEWDWRNARHREDRRIMVANATFGRRLVKICAFFMFSGFVFYYIAVPISVGRIAHAGTNRTFLPLMFPFPKLIANTHVSPANEIIVSIQFVAGMVLHVVAVGSCSLAAVFAAHLCGQMEILICWLGHLVDGRDDMSSTMNGRVASIIPNSRGKDNNSNISRGIFWVHTGRVPAWILRYCGMDVEGNDGYRDVHGATHISHVQYFHILLHRRAGR